MNKNNICRILLKFDFEMTFSISHGRDLFSHVGVDISTYLDLNGGATQATGDSDDKLWLL